MYRLGYDAKRLFNNFTGLGNYSRTLLRNLSEYFPENSYDLYTPKIVRNAETQFFLSSPNFNVHTPTSKTFSALWRSYSIPRLLRRHKIDLYHGLSHELPYNIQNNDVKSVVTIHDLIFKRFPDHYKSADRIIYDFKFKYACQHADVIIAISESTKNDIIEFYNIPAQKITVVYQSCHERFRQEKSLSSINTVLKKYNLPDSFLLFVGSLTERKNLFRVLEAYNFLPTAEKLPLVVIGKGDRYKKNALSYIQEKGLEQLVYFITIDYEELPYLYQAAEIFLYPSLYEGFGLPIIESLCSKTPVITAQNSSLPEAGGPFTIYIDPLDPESIANGISQVLTDNHLKDRMIEHGFVYAQKFNAEALTKELMSVYKTLLER